MIVMYITWHQNLPLPKYRLLGRERILYEFRIWEQNLKKVPDFLILK